MASELLFILLPFVIILVALWAKHELNQVATRPDWPLAAALLFGQAIVKLIGGAIKHGARVHMVRFAVAGGIVLGLTPSLVVLVIDLLSEPEAGPGGLHMLLFFLALIYFCVFNWLGELAERMSEAAGPGN